MKNWNRILTTLSLFLLAYTSVNAQNCNRYIGGDSAKTTISYSIYREYFKKNLYNEAYPEWLNMYTNAPGFRKQVLTDGTTMFGNKIQNTTDKELRQKYIDTLFQIYAKQIQCYGEDEFVLGKKAVDLIKYGKDSDVPEAIKLLERTLQLSGDKAAPYYIQTYFRLIVSQVGQNGITEDFVKSKYDVLSAVLDKNIADPNNKQLQAYKEVKTLLDDMYTKNFADKTDPKDCAKLMEIYLKRYREKPDDLETIKDVYNKTKNCADSNLNVELLKKLNAMAPSYSYAIRLGSIYVKSNKLDSAFMLYQNAIPVETDSTKKADLYYILASIKADGNDFTASRDFAKQALIWRPNMGKAYLLIGNLYLSSGSMCGPGVGFQSQIVLWPAFDYLKKAIEVGSDEVKEEAQKLVSSYTQYLPTKAEITAKKLSVGAPYTVKCWINETTTVQVKK